jgi:hypothetical protein
MSRQTITPQRIAGALAVCLSLILLAMSGISGWQRGGNVLEQGLWAAAAICVTASVHLFPALVRGKSWLYVLWAGGMVVVLASHTQFMVLAERHAGQSRLAAQQKVTSPALESPAVTTPARTADAVSAELSRAHATLAKQAWLPEEKKADLRAQVTSLERELNRITSREQASQQQMEVTTADPLGQRLESAFGLKADAVTLALSLLVALVMEGLAVVMWRLALEQQEAQGEKRTETEKSASESVTVTAVVTNLTVTNDPEPNLILGAATSTQPAAPSIDPHPPKPRRKASPSASLPESEKPKAPRKRKRELPSPVDVARLIKQGELEGKVVSIRNHFRCSQEAARELRSKALETLEDERQPRLAIS